MRKKYLLLIFLIYGTLHFFAAWNGPDTDLVTIDTHDRLKPLKQKYYKTSTLKNTLNVFIKFYQIFVSSQNGPTCKYIPTCSRYGKLAIRKHGFFLGSLMAVDRVLRCNPWNKNHGYDPVEDNYPRFKIKGYRKMRRLYRKLSKKKYKHSSRK